MKQTRFHTLLAAAILLCVSSLGGASQADEPIDQCQGPDASASKVLYVNATPPGPPHTVPIDNDAPLFFIMYKPDCPEPAPGKFVVWMNEGWPTVETITPAAFNLGSTCFPILCSAGASPVAVWKNIPKNSTGRNNFFGDGTGSPPATPCEGESDPPAGNAFPPDSAPTAFFVLSPTQVQQYFSVGDQYTLQGVIFNQCSSGTKAVSITNAVQIEIVE